MLLLIFPTCIEQRQKRRQGQAQAQAAQCGLGDCAETVTAQAHHGLHCTERKLRYGAMQPLPPPGHPRNVNVCREEFLLFLLLLLKEKEEGAKTPKKGGAKKEDARSHYGVA